MKKLTGYFILALLITGFATGSSFATIAEYNEGEVIVVMKAPKGAYSTMSASAYAMALESQAMSFASRKSMSTVHSYSALSQNSGSSIAFFKAEGKTTEQLMNELKDDPEVLLVSPNFKRYATSVPKESYALTNDSMIGKQWGLNRINVFEAWDNYAKWGEVTYVAVLDSGVDYNHEDLRDNIAKDASGKVIGRSFFGNGSYVNDDPMDTSPDGHGTHVAGIIGAVGDNRKGISGVHNKFVKIIPVRVFTGPTYINPGTIDNAWDADILRGLEYVLELKNSGLNIRVVNMSLGGWNAPEDGLVQQLAIERLSDAGIIIVIAAGNEDHDISEPRNIDDKECYPFPAAFWMIENKITVGAVSIISGNRTDFSNYDSGGENSYKPDPDIRFVDMGAPGDFILSTVPGGKYEYLNGTSMAAPFVAGAAAFLCSLFPDKTAGEIKECILNNTFSGMGKGEHWKYGGLNVGKAYLQFDNNPITPIAPDPSLDEMRPVNLEISVDGDIIVDRRVNISVFPNPPGIWTVFPFDRAHIESGRSGSAVLVAKSIGEIEIIYTYTGANKSVVAARRVMQVLDIYHQGKASCNVGMIPMLFIAFMFFTYLASKRKKYLQ